MKKENWINMAKFAAILGVLIHHTDGILDHSRAVLMLSYCAVSLFIFLMGITTYWSFERNFGHLKEKLIQKITSLFVTYLVASAVYQLAFFHSFNLARYVQLVIHFSASGPLYFVLLYIQLLLASPLLFYALKYFRFKLGNGKKMLLAVICLGMAVSVIAVLLARFTNILDIYGGKIFGGKYLILLYAGMVTATYYDKLKASFWKYCLFLILSICWWRFECFDCFALDKKLHFGDGTGSPNLSLALMAFLLAGTLFNLDSLLRRNPILQKVSDAWGLLGTHTLYIFMYHKLFLDFILGNFSFLTKNIWIKRIIYISVMIFASIAIEYAARGVKQLCKRGKRAVAQMAGAQLTEVDKKK